MGKQAVAKSQDNAVAQAGPSAAPAFVIETATRDAGMGLSTDQADNQIPLIYVLQALSPQVNRRSPAYIPNAEPGSLWLRNADVPIVSGDEGIIFQPCVFQKDWVEWVPRDSGGGLVARYDKCPSDAKEVEDAKTKKVRYIRPNGNEVLETRYHIGFVIRDSGPEPFVIPLSSSGHTFSKNWMAMMNRQIPAPGKPAVSFQKYYRLKTVPKSNAKGEWFTWSVEAAGWVPTIEDYNRGRDLAIAFAAGEKTIDVEEHADLADPADDTM